jgi:hypothetical protein
MPDTPVDRRGEAPYPPDLEGRVRALEDLATRTTAAIEMLNRQIADLAAEQRGLRAEVNAALRGIQADMNAESRATRVELNVMRTEHRSDFRMMLGFMIGLAAAGFGLIAHGFHWLP